MVAVACESADSCWVRLKVRHQDQQSWLAGGTDMGSRGSVTPCGETDLAKCMSLSKGAESVTIDRTAPLKLSLPVVIACAD